MKVKYFSSSLRDAAPGNTEATFNQLPFSPKTLGYQQVLLVSTEHCCKNIHSKGAMKTPEESHSIQCQTLRVPDLSATRQAQKGLGRPSETYHKENKHREGAGAALCPGEGLGLPSCKDVPDELTELRCCPHNITAAAVGIPAAVTEGGFVCSYYDLSPC